MRFDFDVIIIGGGPGGATTASYLALAGYKTALIEKSEFPRFKIGESLLPYSKGPLEEINFWQKLESKYIPKFGAKFFSHANDDCFHIVFEKALTEDHPFAYEVQRQDFDQQLLDHAKSCGATVFQPDEAIGIDYDDHSVTVRTTSQTMTAQFLVDASGRNSMTAIKQSHRHTDTSLSHTAIFGHFKDVERSPDKFAGDIIITVLPNLSWSWVIPFLDQSSSVGVVVQSNDFRKYKSNPGGLFWQKISQCNNLQNAMKQSTQSKDFDVVANYSYHCDQLAGHRWISVGDALGFIDPIFSSGVHLAISSAKYASKHIINCLSEGSTLITSDAKHDYEEKIRKGFRRFRWAIDLFYSSKFEEQMKRVMTNEQIRRSFTSLLAGDVWSEENLLFRLNSI